MVARHTGYTSCDGVKSLGKERRRKKKKRPLNRSEDKENSSNKTQKNVRKKKGQRASLWSQKKMVGFIGRISPSTSKSNISFKQCSAEYEQRWLLSEERKITTHKNNTNTSNNEGIVSELPISFPITSRNTDSNHNFTLQISNVMYIRKYWKTSEIA